MHLKLTRFVSRCTVSHCSLLEYASSRVITEKASRFQSAHRPNVYLPVIRLERNDPEIRLAAERSKGRKRCPNNPEATRQKPWGYPRRIHIRSRRPAFHVLTYCCATFVVCGIAYVTADLIGRSRPLARYVSRDYYYWHAFETHDRSRLLRREGEKCVASHTFAGLCANDTRSQRMGLACHMEE